jgi:O-antigen/teichoic acid export membrane protein
MSFQVDNKKIARNTLVLYMRQILIMIISLYTSRVILQTLGAENYGIYNVVGGFVTMFNVLSGAFTVAISRYMQYVIGEGDEKKLKELFSTALVVQCCMGLLIMVLLATGGVWYVKNVMVLPDGRTAAALWVLLFSAVSFFIGLISVPYNSMIVAHEHMKAYAYIAILEALMKLGVAFAIVMSPLDKLITYGFLTMLTSIVVRFCYSVYCNKHFNGCKFNLKIHRALLKEMMSFVGWAFLGNGAITLRDQGTSMIMNLFGGTVVNAARGIAQNVNSAVASFVNNFIQATQPEITKLRATNQLVEMRKLIYRSCRIAYFLMVLICVPLIKNVDYVLTIWLGEVPAYTNIFVMMTLIETMISALNQPLIYGVLAAGEIKVYEIALTIVSLLSLPVNYVILDAGFSPVYVYFFIVFVRTVILLLLVWQSKTYEMTFRDFILNVGFRVALTTMICAAIAFLVNFSAVDTAFLQFLLETALIVCCNTVVIFVFGFTGDEKNKVVIAVKEKILKK